MDKIGFKEYMYGYCAEDYDWYDNDGYRHGTNSVKVFIPELFLDKTSDYMVNLKVSKGTDNVFKNITPPSLLQYVSNKNYLTLPTLNDTTMYFKQNDRVIILFINKNPLNGIVIGRG